MPTIQLIRLDPAIEQSLMADPAYLDAMIAEDWDGVAEIVWRHVGRTLTGEPVSVDRLAWGGYFVVDADTREVVGSCAYKGEPTDGGDVEIAYFTYPGFTGRGYATGMARKLIAMATGGSEARGVIAHTLPEASASTRVLEKAGMAFVGEVVDPEDGAVWQWRWGDV